MSNIRELQTRIKSIGNTAKITHAMELVSAAKMKRAQNIAVSGKPYSNLINNTLRRIANRINPEIHPLLASPQGDKSAIILFSTDRGLAGSINSNLFKETAKLVGDLKFITVGTKGRNYIIKIGKELLADFALPEKPELAHVRPIAKLVIDGFLNNDFDQVNVLYTEFLSTLKQEVITRQLLPIIDQLLLTEITKAAENQKMAEPVFEPNADDVLEQILPQYILMELYQILLEAKASEHSARMIAMKSSTDNALELVDDLTLEYNSIRQAAITTEILDITTAQLGLG